MKVARLIGLLRRPPVLAGAFVVVALASAVAAAPPEAAAVTDGREQDVPRYDAVAPGEPEVGRIDIPRVGVSAVILEGVDYKTIRRAVGHFPHTSMPDQSGNMALAAHRTTQFYGLRNIRIGDDVTITSRRGASHYQVEKLWVVNPEDVSVLDPSAETVLTLVTCFPFDFHGAAPQRFIVRARAIEAAAQPISSSGKSADALLGH
jgi:sortase A